MRRIDITSDRPAGSLRDDAEMYVFDSMTELVDHANQVHFKQQPKSFLGLGVETWDEVMAQARSEWPEGIDILERYVEDLSSADLDEIKSHIRKVTFNEWEGDEVDYDRLRSGQDFWRVSSREETTGPTTVTVITDLATAGGVAPEKVLWRGAAAIALTEILEAKGYSVELWAVNGSHIFLGNEKRLGLACCLKRCSDPLDRSTLINTVSAWFYRTINFTVRKSIVAENGDNYKSTLGGVFSWSPSELDYITPDERRAYISGVFSYGGALDLVRAELENINTVSEEN